MVEKLFTAGETWREYTITAVLRTDEEPLEYYRTHRDTLLICRNMRGVTVSAAQCEAFANTLGLMARVPDERIGRIMEGGFSDGFFWAVAEDFKGVSLRVFFTCQVEEYRPPVPHTLSFVRECAEALEKLQAHGVCHFGLNSECVYLSPTFRLARITPGFDALFGVEPCLSQLVVSRAPELLRGEASDHRADMYAMAALLHEIIVHEPPFLGDGTGVPKAAKLRELALSEVPPPMHTFRKGVPDAVERFVARGLAKCPDDRFRSWAEFIDELDRIGSHLPGWKAIREGRDLPPFLAQQIAAAASHVDSTRAAEATQAAKSGVRETAAPEGPPTEPDPITLPSGTSLLQSGSPANPDHSVQPSSDGGIEDALAVLGDALMRHGASPDLFENVARAARAHVDSGAALDAASLRGGASSGSTNTLEEATPRSSGKEPLSVDVPISDNEAAVAPREDDNTAQRTPNEGVRKPVGRARVFVPAALGLICLCAAIALLARHRTEPPKLARTHVIPIEVPTRIEPAPLPVIDPVHETQPSDVARVKLPRQRSAHVVVPATPEQQPTRPAVHESNSTLTTGAPSPMFRELYRHQRRP